jgi:hypothetical protein
MGVENDPLYNADAGTRALVGTWYNHTTGGDMVHSDPTSIFDPVPLNDIRLSTFVATVDAVGGEG